MDGVAGNFIPVSSDRGVRAVSFGSAAEDYDRFRPAPPEAVVEWFLPDGARRVGDVCAGTGGFSRVLALHAAEVVAVEIDPRMLSVLTDHSPGVRAVCGRGEDLPVRDGALDAVTVSSAWHWLDPDACLPEVARVLRPGGVLGVVWNGPARHIEWVGELLGRSQRTPTEADRPAPIPEGRPDRLLSIPAGLPFSEPEFRAIDWSLPRTPEQLAGLCGTYSRVTSLDPGQRESVVREAMDYIGSHPMLAGRSLIDLPMRARCWRSVRSPSGS